MAAERYDDILRRAREELNRDEQLQLARALSQPAPDRNGADQQKSLYDALKERGIIGSITDAPSDLGTNPKYLEGFGRDD